MFSPDFYMALGISVLKKPGLCDTSLVVIKQAVKCQVHVHVPFPPEQACKHTVTSQYFTITRVPTLHDLYISCHYFFVALVNLEL